MWEVFESKQAQKAVPKLPPSVLEKYEFWKNIVVLSGPSGLRAIPGFHDEALAGEWKGHRSSRLSIHFRVIYRVDGEKVRVFVERLTAHDYRR